MRFDRHARMDNLTTTIREKMARCSIENAYSGLDDLSELSEIAPDDAGKIAWDVLVQRSDPGKDDHALCYDVMQILVSAVGKSAVEALVYEEWTKIKDDIRLNLLSGVETGGFELDFVKRLFDSPHSSVLVRHQIVSRLASHRFAESSDILLELASGIGTYDDSNRQDMLQSFTEKLRMALGNG